jgi:hypothetical protein
MNPFLISAPYPWWFYTAKRLCVRLMTLVAVVSLTSCAYLKDHTLDQCKTHAYVETVIADYLSTRYQSNSHVRMGIIPFAVPANLTQKPFQYRGLGNEIAFQIQAHFLNEEVIPISEVLNREDWPGKKDEFYTGNFGALSQAREAGYDLIFVGNIDAYNPFGELTASTKLIEVESGVTLWYGKTTAYTHRRDYMRGADYLNLEDRKPSETFGEVLTSTLTKCIVKEVLSEERGM